MIHLRLFAIHTVQNTDGRTGLILACCKGEKVVAKSLIDKGANVDHQDKVKKTVFNNVHDHIILIRYLSQIGYTPLHYASRNGHTDVVEMLIENGAQIDVPAKVSKSGCISLSLS